MRVLGWGAVTVSFLVAGYCAAVALVGVTAGALALWIDPHAGVAALLVSGPVVALLVLRRSADAAVRHLDHLPPAHPYVDDRFRSAIRTRRKHKLTVRSCPGDRVVVLRGRRRTMVLAPVGIEPFEAARHAARDLDLGQGWILPWVMRVVRIPGIYLGGISQLRRTRDVSEGQARPSDGGSIGPFLASLVLAPAALVGWVGGQLAMLLVRPRLLAAYAALTGAQTRDGLLGLRQRLLLPFTWYTCANRPRERFEPAYADLAAGYAEPVDRAQFDVVGASQVLIDPSPHAAAPVDPAPVDPAYGSSAAGGDPAYGTLAPGDPAYGTSAPGDPGCNPEPAGANADRTDDKTDQSARRASSSTDSRMPAGVPFLALILSMLYVGGLYLIGSWIEDCVIWWDERPVAATVVKADVIEFTKQGISIGYHPLQRLTVALPDGETSSVESQATTYEPGDSIQLAEPLARAGGAPQLRAVPGESTRDHVVNVIYGLGWTALLSLVITFQGGRKTRDWIWEGSPASKDG